MQDDAEELALCSPCVRAEADGEHQAVARRGASAAPPPAWIVVMSRSSNGEQQVCLAFFHVFFFFWPRFTFSAVFYVFFVCFSFYFRMFSPTKVYLFFMCNISSLCAISYVPMVAKCISIKLMITI